MPSHLRAVLPGLVLLAACHTHPALDFGSGLDVPYVQTSPAVVRKMLDLAEVKKDELVIDLGCGDGRIPIAAATDFGARAIGFDLDPDRIAEAIANSRGAGVQSRARFIRQNLFDAPIGRANVVTFFLLPPVVDRLRPRLRSELGPGARIVSHSFPIRTWTPEKTAHIEGRTLYLYRIPQSLPPLTPGPAVPAP